MSTTLPAVTLPAALAAGRVYRLGGEILLDERVSWCPPGVRRSQPVNAYVIRAESERERAAVLVDTGVRLHEREILAQLEEILDPGEPLSILLTRTEMECCLNIPAIEARFHVTSIWYTGGITVPRSSAPAQRVSVDPGTSMEIEVADGVTLELVSPLLRLLPTLWVFDPASGVLLTSDAFTHNSGSAEGSADGSEDSSPGGDPGEGLVKFQWFRSADTAPIAADVHRIVESRQVTAIGPGYGLPFVGREECRRAASALAARLEEVGAR